MGTKSKKSSASFILLCRALAALLLWFNLILPLDAAAQIPNIPSSVDAGRIEERLSPPKPEAPPLATPEIEGAHAPAVEIPPGADTIHFVLHAITVNGATAYSPEQLKALYADKLEKEISLADIYRIAAAITELYRHDGYILSRAIVPPQAIGNGMVTLLVTEGYIGKVIPEGKAYEDSFVTQGIISDIESMRPLNAITLERDILLLNDLAGVSARAVMEPMPEDHPQEGAVAMRIIFDEQPNIYSFSIDNYGTRYLGPGEGTLSGGAHSIFVPYDQFSLTGMEVSPLNEMHSLSGQYKVPLNSDGLSFNMGYSSSKASSGYRLREYDLINTSHTLTGGLSWEAIRQRDENLTFNETLSIKNIRSNILQSPLYYDRTRGLNTSATYVKSDSWKGNNTFDIGFTQGLNILNPSLPGSPDLSRAVGHSDFLKMDFTVSRLQELQDIVPDLQAYISTTGQFAKTPLLTSEQFGYGGQVFGRAYDASEITGDDGLAGSAELRYNGLPTWKNSSAQPFVFYDVGTVWNLGQNGPREYGSSAGFGVRATIDARVSATFTIAQPLTRNVATALPNDGHNPRAFFSLTVQF